MMKTAKQFCMQYGSSSSINMQYEHILLTYYKIIQSSKMDFRVRHLKRNDGWRKDEDGLASVLRDLVNVIKDTNNYLMENHKQRQETQKILLQIKSSLDEKQKSMKSVQKHINKMVESNCSAMERIVKHLDRGLVDSKTNEISQKSVYEANSFLKQNRDTITLQSTYEDSKVENDLRLEKSSKIVNQIKQFTLCPMVPRHLELRLQCQSLSPNKQLRRQQIKKYIAQMTSQVFSVSFNMFFKEKVDFEKIKAHCSQNILGNFVELIKTQKLRSNEIGMIDRHLIYKVLEYIQVSYPRSEQKQDSSKLENLIVQKNIFNENRFDLIANSPLKKMTWHYLPDEDKHDRGNRTFKQVMRLLNYIIELPDKKIINKNGSQQTLFEQFESDMKSCFEVIFDKSVSDFLRNKNKKQNVFRNKHTSMEENKVIDFTNLLKFYVETKQLSEKVSEKQKAEYAQKVRSFTKIKIGRKISSNSKRYSESDIIKGDFKIKDSAIRRILSKWIQTLQEYIQKSAESTILRNDPLRLDDGSQNTNEGLQQKQKLFDFFNEVQPVIDAHTVEIKNNIYETFVQSVVNEQNLTFDSDFCSERQAKIGNLCTVFSYASQSYILKYLKLLINSLKQIQTKYYDNFKDSPIPENEKKPLLVTLKLGDLMRCQVSSRQNQIIAIYEYLLMLCQCNPEIYELVRVKNRFDSPNKDILVNIWYHKTIMVEIQLAIKSESPFLQCSDKFCHFIYELTRDILGPISELTQIWNKYSPKSGFFSRMIKKKIKSISFQASKKNRCREQNHFYVQRQGDNLPYWCSNCRVFQSYPTKNVICQNCNKKLCLLCRNTDKITALYENRMKLNVKQMKKGMILRGIQVHSKNTQHYICLQFMGKFCIYSFQYNEKSQNQFSEIKKRYDEVRSSKLNQIEFTDFLNRNIILEEVLTINSAKLISLIFFGFWEKEIKKISKRKTKTLSLIFSSYPRIEKSQKRQLIHQLLNSSSLTHLGTSIENLNIQQSHLISLSNLKNFKSLKFLNGNSNKITSLESLPDFPELQQLQLNNNQIKDLRTQCELRNLKILELSNNQICSFSGLKQFNNIKVLNFNSNQIRSLAQIPKLITLQRLLLVKNELSSLQGLPQLPNLIELDARQNNVNSLQGLPKLINLKVMNMLSNSLKSINGLEEISKFPLIESLNLSKNKLESIQVLPQFTYMKELNLSDNSIKSLSQFPRLKSLQILNLSSNGLKETLQFPQLQNLRVLNLSSNQISALEGMKDLVNLKKLYLSNNKLVSLKGVSELFGLTELEANNNQICSCEQISQIKSLQKVRLSMNKISLAKDFQNMENLRQLVLADNQIQTIEIHSNLRLLKKLNLERNKMTNLRWLQELQNLKQLNLKSNSINSLQGMVNQVSLQRLDLSRNMLVSLRSLPQLQNLKELNVQYNQIENIQHCPYLQSLEIFNFSMNKCNLEPKKSKLKFPRLKTH